MMKEGYYKSHKLRNILTDNQEFILIILILSFASRINYVLFHFMVGIITVTINFSIMIIVLCTIKTCENNYYTFLGMAYGFIGLVDALHIFTYSGFNIFLDNANLSAQLWIFSRFFECILLLISFRFTNKKVNYRKMMILNTVIIVIFLSSIFTFKIFPTCYIKGYGFTTFKRVSEYLICLIFFIIMILYIKSEGRSINKGFKQLIFAMLFKFLSEVSLAVYNLQGYVIPTFLSHMFKLISFCFFYKVLFKNVVINPYSNLFQNLNRKAIELEGANKELLKAKLKIERDYEKHEKLMSFLPDGILVLREDKIIYSNNTFYNMLGISGEKKILDKSIFDIIHSRYHEQLQRNLDSISKNNILGPEEYEIFIDDRNLHVDISVYVDISTLYPEEESEVLILVIRNITDRKEAEKMSALLLAKGKEEELKNEFFANLSHEFKTPVNVIYSAIQLQSKALNAETISKYNKVIGQNCLRLLRLINNLIDITKIESGFFKPVFSTENIVSIIEEVTQSIVSYAQCRNMNLVFDTEFEEIYVKCDSTLIERIILNLLSNSVKYGKDHGNIKVNIYRMEEGTVTISIKDDGIGIPEHMQDKIFERFQKVDNSLSRNTEGSGIGLSLVKYLVEMHGGAVYCKSKIDEGTEFFVNFPIVEESNEVCATMENRELKCQTNIIEKVNIEFSDIYS